MFWFIILFPLLIYPWGIDPYYTYPKTGYLYAFVLGTWLYLIFKRKYRTLLPEKHDSTIFIILLSYITLIEISTAFSEYNYTSVYGLIDRKEGLISFFCYFSVFIFSYRLIAEKKINIVLSGISIVSVLVSLYGILQHYRLDFLPRNSMMIDFDRAYTFFDHANFYGSYLVLVLLLSVSLYLYSSNKKYSILYYISTSLAFISLLFTTTRSGYVGVFCGIVFLTLFVVVKNKYLWKKWAVILASLVILLLTINIIEQGLYLKRMSTVVTESYVIATDQETGYEGSARLFIWEESLPLLKKYFWLGSGPDTFPFIFTATPEERKTYFGYENVGVDKAHNEYLQIAITLGTPALVVYLIFLILIIKKTFVAVKLANGKEKILLNGLLAVIFGYLIQAFFNISTVPVAPLFWSILGITLAKAAIVIKNANEQNNKLMNPNKQTA